MGLSLAQQYARLPRPLREQWIDQQEAWVLEEIARGEWWWLARPEQVPDESLPWLVWLMLAGRGFGKSRSGSEWIVERTQKHPVDAHGAPTEHLVVAETLSDARAICMEGPAGILRVLARREIVHRYKQTPKPTIIFPNGSKIYCEGADDADVGRGYTLATLWADEICKWPTAYDSWYEGLLPAMRADLINDQPRALATTTPKPIKLLKAWLADAQSDNEELRRTIHVVTGSTFDNKDNLNQHVITVLKKKYEGTAIGRQELHGEMLEAMDGALFKRVHINGARVEVLPPSVVSIVVGVDPSLAAEGDDEPVSSRSGRSKGTRHDTHDEMGVIVVARTRDDHHYVLADASIKDAGRSAALHCWRTLLKYEAGMLVYENNLGKKWMEQVFKDAWAELVQLGEAPANTSPPMRGVDAKLGKKTRAEPVAMRCEQGQLHMVGFHETLEDQLTGFSSWDGKESPDRLDAMVHACRHLIEMENSKGRIIDPNEVDEKRPSRWDDGMGHGFDFWR